MKSLHQDVLYESINCGPLVHDTILPMIWIWTEGLDHLKIFVDYKQLLDEVFVISRIIKVEIRVISRSRRLRLITLTETLIILDITKTESNNCFIIH